jgi:Domain of Unknown Function (DUF1080)
MTIVDDLPRRLLISDKITVPVLNIFFVNRHETNMRNCLRFLICIVLIVGSCPVIRAQQIDLLVGDGRNNWVKADGQPIDTTKWELNDGILHLTGGGGGDIFFRNSIGDFELSFEWRIAEKGNSGVKYRVQKYGDSWLGCEYQLQDDVAAPLSRHSTASLYDVFAPTGVQRPNAAGEWNTSRIVVIGNQIQHWLNGAMVVYATTDSWDWHSRVCNSKFREHCGWGQNCIGRLMLQDHGSEVWFRDMKLTIFSTSMASTIAGGQRFATNDAKCNPNDHTRPDCQSVFGGRSVFFHRRRLLGR